MKALVVIQKVLAVILGAYGVCLMFSEAPIDASILYQLSGTVSGIILIGLAAGWLALIRLEENLFINKRR